MGSSTKNIDQIQLNDEDINCRDEQSPDIADSHSIVTGIVEDTVKREGAGSMNSQASSDSELSNAQIRPAMLEPDGPEDQLRYNQKANRKMRWMAFGVIGGLIVFFFLLLMAALFKIFFGSYLASIISAASVGWQWHILIFLGATLVLLAAVPLSLSLALVRMISDKKDDEAQEIKAPSVELIKALAHICKSVATSMKQ